ncbi:MAG: HAD-IA family hydrolase [Oscillospiraceae bacterium]
MEKKYSTILFDLDGTIINSQDGITKCLQYALECIGITIPDLKVLTPFIGPPLTVGFGAHFPNLTDEQIAFAIEKYRERYQKTGMMEHYLYDGIPELLKTLQDSGKKLILATSKPLEYAKLLLEHNGLTGYFNDIVGCGLDGTLNTKGEVIAYALQKNNINDISEVLMVGDTKYDLDGAKQNGIDCLCVLYGFGKRHELQDAEYIASTVAELREFLTLH